MAAANLINIFGHMFIPSIFLFVFVVPNHNNNDDGDRQNDEFFSWIAKENEDLKKTKR